MYDVYLKTTPLKLLYDSSIGYSLSNILEQNAVIFGTSGAGKTTLLAHWLLEIIPKGIATVIIDPDGDFAEEFEQLEIWKHKELITVNARNSPALNMWDVPSDATTLSEIVQLYAFLFKGEDLTLTGPQRTMLSHVVAVMLAKHREVKATLQDMFDLAEEDLGSGRNQKRPQDSAFWKWILKTDTHTINYFKNRFWGSHAAPSKAALLNRLDTIISDKMLLSMFMAQENKLNLWSALHERKATVLINAKGLGAGKETFLRYIVLRVLQVALKRTSIPKKDRHPILLFVDEAQRVLVSDHEAQIIADETRKLGLFMRAFSHRYKSIPPVFTGSCGMKLVSMPDSSDLSDFAREFKCRSDLIDVQNTDKLNYTLWQRDHKAMRITLPKPTTGDKFPPQLKMSLDELRPLQKKWRDALKAEPKPEPQDIPTPESEPEEYKPSKA